MVAAQWLLIIAAAAAARHHRRIGGEDGCALYSKQSIMPCVKGSTFGCLADRAIVWIKGGCRATIQVRARNGPTENIRCGEPGDSPNVQYCNARGVVTRPHVRMQSGPPGYVFAAEDNSEEARQWRNRSSVQFALQQMAYEYSGNYSAAWRYKDRWMVTPDGRSWISLHDVATLFEIALGPMGLHAQAAAAVGVEWFGVDTQQSVTDSQMLHSLLWRLRVDLVVELGTMCGGSAIFYAKTMMAYNPRAKVLTYDVALEQQRLRLCEPFSRRRSQSPGARGLVPGLQHKHWTDLKASGNIVPVIGDPTARRSAQHELLNLTSQAQVVMVIDDGAHEMLPVIRHFKQLRQFVTPGSYYLAQDTRLDTDCAYAILTSRQHWCEPWAKLRQLGQGYAGLAIDSLTQTAEFAQEWEQDRTIEAWGVTQHPGGYLRRKITNT
uniref:Rhamnosyl O-methyltransferase n=1 Tax=Calcidiscus leptoporus TaxID=127549 RepID=A0A7S0P3H3_9EUKA|mmetsp:Transcript_5067/g.11551  ORF Transcript_5067/g.11551 Transcript_5067/m.11551 type:complete len:436 (+) Transcript_5067:62-1369(+)